MKNFLICLMLSTLLYAQDCVVTKSGGSPFFGMFYPGTEIYLFEKYELDLSKMPNVRPEVTNYSMSEDNYWAYLAQSDSSIMVFILEDGLSFFKLCSSKEDCDSKATNFYIRNLIIEEFMRLQPAGVFRGTAEEADSLILHIVDKLENEPFNTQSFDSKTYNYANQDTDEADMVLSAATLCTHTAGKYNGDLCGLIDSVRQCILPLNNSGIERLHTLRKTSSEKLYRIFDLNGNYIGCEKYGNVQKYHIPVVFQRAKKRTPEGVR